MISISLKPDRTWPSFPSAATRILYFVSGSRPFRLTLFLLTVRPLQSREDSPGMRFSGLILVAGVYSTLYCLSIDNRLLPFASHVIVASDDDLKATWIFSGAEILVEKLFFVFRKVQKVKTGEIDIVNQELFLNDEFPSKMTLQNDVITSVFF